MQPDSSELIGAIRSAARPVAPAVPSLPPAFSALVGAPLPRRPRAALFDIYGTLFTSESGDIGLTRSEAAERACRVALHRLTAVRSAAEPNRPEVERSIPKPARVAAQMRAQIESHHQQARQRGAIQPEVDIRTVWCEVFSILGCPVTDDEATRFALDYELAVNPAWPMPGFRDCISAIADHLALGLVSNAQFYTPLLFNALLHQAPDQLGFAPDYTAYSFEHGIAKPDPRLFDAPLAALAEQGIDSQQVVYVGNDMLNDVTCAASRGCLTILFAGDARSLRLREDHQAAGRTRPDSVAQSLGQVAATVLDLKEKP